VPFIHCCRSGPGGGIGVASTTAVTTMASAAARSFHDSAAAITLRTLAELCTQHRKTAASAAVQQRGAAQIDQRPDVPASRAAAAC